MANFVKKETSITVTRMKPLMGSTLQFCSMKKVDYRRPWRRKLPLIMLWFPLLALVISTPGQATSLLTGASSSFDDVRVALDAFHATVMEVQAAQAAELRLLKASSSAERHQAVLGGSLLGRRSQVIPPPPVSDSLRITRVSGLPNPCAVVSNSSNAVPGNATCFRGSAPFALSGTSDYTGGSMLTFAGSGFSALGQNPLIRVSVAIEPGESGGAAPRIVTAVCRAPPTEANIVQADELMACVLAGPLPIGPAIVNISSPALPGGSIASGTFDFVAGNSSSDNNSSSSDSSGSSSGNSSSARGGTGAGSSSSIIISAGSSEFGSISFVSTCDAGTFPYVPGQPWSSGVPAASVPFPLICAKCPTGATCAGALAVPVSARRYWPTLPEQWAARNIDVTVVGAPPFVGCPLPDACLYNASCFIGYDSRSWACSACAPGWARRGNGLCSPCPSEAASWGIVLVAALGASLFSAFLIRGSMQRRSKLVIIGRSLINYMQVRALQ